MSMFSEIAIDAILKDINLKIEQLENSEESDSGNKDVIEGLKIAREIIASHY